jgi:hypothetical protein
VITDTNGNVFGGFTPLKWESRVWNDQYSAPSNAWKRDDSDKSFIFTLSNPSKSLPMKYRLKSEYNRYAIWTAKSVGPAFGGGCAICVKEGCNKGPVSYEKPKETYINPDGPKYFTVVTSQEKPVLFTVKEIEVFQITS